MSDIDLTAVEAHQLKGARARWPVVGDFNILEASIGARGFGKSTYQAIRAHELQHQYGAIVIGHSMGQRLPERLPDGIYGGVRLPIRYYRNLDELQRGLIKRPMDWHILAPPIAGEDPTPDRPKSSCDDLLRWSISLSYALRSQAFKDAHPWRSLLPSGGGRRFLGLRARPIVVIVDEGVALGGAATGDRGQSKDTDWFREYLFSLRHAHIALLYAIQEPTSRSWRLLEQATAIHVFHLKHEWALNAIRAAGADDEQLEAIRNLRPYERVTLT